MFPLQRRTDGDVMTTRFDSDGNEIQDAGTLAYADDLDAGIVEEPPRTSRKPAIAIMAAFVVGALVLFGFALWPRSSTATATVTGPRLSADPTGAQAPVFSGTQAPPTRLSWPTTRQAGRLRARLASAGEAQVVAGEEVAAKLPSSASTATAPPPARTPTTRPTAWTTRASSTDSRGVGVTGLLNVRDLPRRDRRGLVSRLDAATLDAMIEHHRRRSSRRRGSPWPAPPARRPARVPGAGRVGVGAAAPAGRYRRPAFRRGTGPTSRDVLNVPLRRMGPGPGAKMEAL
jgi:hypothetical protein